ncbi:MAG TPA: phosphatase PAP2 family protein [Pseudonocardia sp.]|nr:phosphatase PAP2 family protein [Pseudonocardia sp.]
MLAIVGPGLTGLATTTLKPLIGRTFNGEFAFPSGHTGGATALGLVAALLVIRAVRAEHAAGATLVAVGTVVSGGTMALALIGGQEHYPTDTVGGFFVAVAVVLLSALTIDWSAGRLRSPDPHHPGAGPAGGGRPARRRAARHRRRDRGVVDLTG